jgi:hypothetical protein
MKNYMREEGRLPVKGDRGGLVMTFSMRKRLKNAHSDLI